MYWIAPLYFGGTVAFEILQTAELLARHYWISLPLAMICPLFSQQAPGQPDLHREKQLELAR